MRSLPQVTIRPLDGSMSMWAMLCFPSWNVANAVRLQHTHTHTHKQLSIRFALSMLKIWVKCDRLHQILEKPLTHSSSLMVSKQASHTRTGNSKPMIGYVERLELHFPQTAWPHFLQWCCTKKKISSILAWLMGWGTQNWGGGTLARLSYLSEAQGLSVPHLLDVPKERLLTLLTGVAV